MWIELLFGCIKGGKLMKNNNNLKGIIPYLISPINKPSGEVRTDVLFRLCIDLISEGVHGLSPLGSTGEVHYLNWEQKKEIVNVVFDASNGEVPVIPGVSSYTATDAITQINHFEKMGIKNVVLILNTYFPLTRDN